MSFTNVPFLPGYQGAPQKLGLNHKTHKFDITNGILVPDKDVDANRKVRNTTNITKLACSTRIRLDPSASLRRDPVPSDYPSESFDRVVVRRPTKQPSFVAYDKKVLRFYGWYDEAVYQGTSVAERGACSRIHKVIFYYYLEDDTVHVEEPKTYNSGIGQGLFVKRHALMIDTDPLRERPRQVKWQDLCIGGSPLQVYGRQINLVDADEFTRTFYAAENRELRNPVEYPQDVFESQSKQKRTNFNKVMTEDKEFMEVSLGRAMGIRIAPTVQFLKNDRKVLRFYVTWADSTMFGEKRPFIMHYYLADNTVEVVEVKQENSGRAPFPVLLKRNRLAKDALNVVPSVARLGSREREEDKKLISYYTEEDFQVGGSINVFGREMDIRGCDRFTKNFYINKYGMAEEDFPDLMMEEEFEQMPTFLLPPHHNGVGTEEDSLSSFLFTNPKIPKKDFKKMMEKNGVHIRFLAQLHQPKHEDESRRFVISYLLDSDEVNIFEQERRNSGFIGGRFLWRSRVQNPTTHAYYKAEDFYVGAVLSINNFVFELLKADDYTNRILVESLENRTSIAEAVTLLGLDKNAAGELQDHSELEQLLLKEDVRRMGEDGCAEVQF